MAKNPLQDQLLKAGLVKKQDIKNVNKQQQKQAKIDPAVLNEAAELAKKAQAEKLERDRALAEQQKLEQQQKALAAQVRQIIQHSRIVREQGDVAYHFKDGKSVKKLYVTQKLWDELSAGKLAIARQDDVYELVPAVVAEKLQERGPAALVAWHKPEKAAVDEDDPYAAYQIPDDLMW
ncbi:Conserved hypothetical protein [gamma proteobacterium HdN1]|nr:Conserved hypothetical protein [gamma proteobacterium HdN1]